MTGNAVVTTMLSSAVMNSPMARQDQRPDAMRRRLAGSVQGCGASSTKRHFFSGLGRFKRQA